MKVLNVHIPRIVKNIAVTAPLMLATPLLKAQSQELQADVFEKTESVELINSADSTLLSPGVIVGDDLVYPAVVVDLSEGRLYHYDYDGYLRDVYPIASGKSTTPTIPGLRIISDIEAYPYKNAPKTTKRYKNPNDYGTHLLNLSIVDQKTGEITGSNGQFIHGTFKPSSIGNKVSKGCVRVNNDAIDTLAKSLSKGQYVLIME